MEKKNKIEDLDNLLKRLQPYLKRYLIERGITIKDNGMFSCINPKHKDDTPSAGFVPGTNEEMFNCFGCGAKGSIFHAAYLLEGKPLRGQEFITDNVVYIADKYGVAYDTVELTPEELYIIRVYNAYKDAADIISEWQPLEYISKRKWPVSLCRELQVGSVRGYAEFLSKMESRGYERSFIDEIDLNKSIFNEGMLVFTVRDEKGRVVGFSARDMSHSKESKRSKFINTSAKCPIYNKGIILYGLNSARYFQPPLYIFEGYPDYVTSYKHNLKNVCAIGGTALTREHIDLIKELGISDIILALDGDVAGQNKIESLLDDYFGGDETIQVRVLRLPTNNEECDPDDFIEKYGVEEFKKLPALTPFQWRLDRFSYDTKPENICDRMIPFIINDPNEVHRETMARELSDKTGIRLKTVLKQVDKLINAEEAQKEGVVQTKIRQLIDELRISQEDPATLLEATAEELRQVQSESREDINSPVELVHFLDTIRKIFAERKQGLQGWKTGFDAFDEAISGIPKEDAMITFAGDSNLGKSGWMFELAIRLAKYNDDILVLFMSIDDSRQQAIARLVALESGLKINQVSHPSQNITTQEDLDRLDAGWASIRKLIMEDKFSIKDNTHGNTLDFAEGWVRWAKATYPNKKIAFFLDNFHKLEDERNKDERIRFKHASARIHAMKNKLHFTAICTMELRKFIGSAIQRPSLQDISESKQMEYDNNLIGMIYNDVHYRRHDAKVFWTGMDENDLAKKPVVEIDIQKNKISEFKDILYYKFSPERSKFDECTGEEVSEWKKEYESAIKQVINKKFPDEGENPFLSGGKSDN